VTEDEWTCPCGHELDPDDREVCLVWDDRERPHRVRRSSPVCECHGITVTELEPRR
jgi:hypothetical protein